MNLQSRITDHARLYRARRCLGFLALGSAVSHRADSLPDRCAGRRADRSGVSGSVMSLQCPGAVGVGAASSSAVSSRQRAGSRARRTRTRVGLVAYRLADLLQLSCYRRQRQFRIHRGLALYRAGRKFTALEGDFAAARRTV